MERYRNQILIAIFVITALLGVGIGYLLLGPMRIAAMDGNTQPEAAVYEQHIAAFGGAPTEIEPEAFFAEAYTQVYAPAQHPTTHFQPPQPAPPHEETHHRYIVTTLNGYIVVYYATPDGKASNNLRKLTTTSTTALPHEERHRLDEGILIYTEEALVRILEAYGS